jgi:hypothetical protein
VRVLSRLFRRLVLEKLDAVHRAEQLQFFGKHAALTNERAFAAYVSGGDCLPGNQLSAPFGLTGNRCRF